MGTLETSGIQEIQLTTLKDSVNFSKNVSLACFCASLRQKEVKLFYYLKSTPPVKVNLQITAE